MYARTRTETARAMAHGQDVSGVNVEYHLHETLKYVHHYLTPHSEKRVVMFKANARRGADGYITQPTILKALSHASGSLSNRPPVIATSHGRRLRT